ncbi:glycosyltransferase [Flavimarina sp. Hel_I_48]|uniref:glycosyltransferase n=1 Tax=Flavimarina sp. Hel_I_48 TaxID=1392488 RepID=UPI0004DF4303|nr:glycosyltransferase [Flavimarina sp. Hel_I_48]
MTFLVYTTLTEWIEPPRSRHQVTNELKKNGTVYFVEKSRKGTLHIEIKKVDENVYRIIPYFPIDYRIRYRTPFLNEYYHTWLIKKIQKINLDFDIVISFDHTSYLLKNHYSNLIYYCGDDFIGNSKIKFFLINWYHLYIERKLIKAAKLCTVTSRFLLNKLSKINSNTHIVPLGAPDPPSNAKFKKSFNELPVLGLVAFINNRIPLDLLDELLKKLKIIFIGPADTAILKRYELTENAEFVGIKKSDELQKSLNEIDVCIAPYSEITINKGLTPNKLWLYLSCGKPTVVTDVPNIKDWSFEEKVVYKSSNENFYENCLLAHKENNPILFQKRISAAKINSWEHKVEEILKLYEASK